MHQSGGLIIHSNAEVKRVKSIQFGLLSPEAIQNMAVCEINNPRSFEDNGTPTEGGINDLRMGIKDKNFDKQHANATLLIVQDILALFI